MHLPSLHSSVTLHRTTDLVSVTSLQEKTQSRQQLKYEPLIASHKIPTSHREDGRRLAGLPPRSDALQQVCRDNRSSHLPLVPSVYRAMLFLSNQELTQHTFSRPRQSAAHDPVLLALPSLVPDALPDYNDQHTRSSISSPLSDNSSDPDAPEIQPGSSPEMSPHREVHRTLSRGSNSLRCQQQQQRPEDR